MREIITSIRVKLARRRDGGDGDRRAPLRSSLVIMMLGPEGRFRLSGRYRRGSEKAVSCIDLTVEEGREKTRRGGRGS